MNIVVLGGAGAMGGHIARTIIEYSDAQVTVADYRVSEARALARDLGERVRGIFVDASNRDSLLLALREADVAIGAIGPFYRFAPKLAWAAIESEVHYVDICDDHGPIDVLFEFDAVARKVGTTLITGLGWTPGLSNILAQHGASQLDTVDEIRIAWAGSAVDSEGLTVIRHMLYAISGQVPTYRDGSWDSVPALSEPETVRFPEPLGEIEVFHVGHPEPVTIPRTIGVQTVTLKGALVPNWNNRLAGWLVRLGMTSSDKRIDRMSRLIHRLQRLLGAGGVALSGIRVDVTGSRNGEQVTFSFSVVDHMARLTAIPAAIGAIMLVRGEIQAPGVFAPEAIIEPSLFLDRLAERGIVISEEETAAPQRVRPIPEASAAVVPAVSAVPSATLTEEHVAEVLLGVDRGRPVEDRREAATPRVRVPTATLREGVIATVPLAVDRDGSSTTTRISSRKMVQPTTES